MRRTPRTLAIIVVLLAGCGTSPPTTYYALAPADIPFEKAPDTAPILGIGPLRTPEYLERPQIVTRRENSRMNVDDYNRWVEPIADAQYRIIAVNVDALLSNTLVIAYPYGSLADYDYRMTGRINRFDMDYSGNTVLDILWSIQTPDGTIKVSPRRSQIRVAGGNPDDPGSIAFAMNECLEQFSREIASSFAETLDQQ